MLYPILFCLCTLTFFFQTGVAFLPSFLKPCSGPETSQCWRQSIEESRPYLIAGIESLNMPPIDPIYIPKLSVRRNISDTAMYDIQFKSILLTGARNFQILRATIDPVSLVIKLKLGFPDITWSCNGKAVGIIFGFPINSTFRSDIILTNLILDLSLDGEEYESQSKTYVRWNRGSVEAFYDSAHHTVFEALSDPVALQDLNDVMNQKGEIIKPHVTPLVENTLGTFVIMLLNRLHATFPRELLFPKD